MELGKHFFFQFETEWTMLCEWEGAISPLPEEGLRSHRGFFSPPCSKLM